MFFCENSGFESVLLASSRVDDSVCDCCDGSDESSTGMHAWFGLMAACPNTCEELGRIKREKLEYERKLRLEVRRCGIESCSIQHKAVI